MRKTLSAAILLTLAAGAQADEKHCLALQQTTLPDTVINSVTWSDGAIGGDNMAALTGGSAAAQKAPPHCVVSGEIGARTGADGKHYGIKFQLRLPANWNQRFLFQGGGGVDGFVAPAVGNIPVRSSTATPART